MNCPNCGAALAGKFCSSCGQEDIDYNVSLRRLIPEVLDEYFGIDSRLFKSIPLLLFKPGFLTKAFNAGKRERYVSPVRIYIIVSILFFLVISFTNNGAPVRFVNSSDSTSAAAPPVRGAEARKSLSYNLTMPFFGSDSANAQSSWGRFVKRQLGKIVQRENEFISQLEYHYPEMMIFFLPISAILLKLLYFFQKRLYMEHLIFSLHLHSFVFLALAAGSIAGYVFHSSLSSLIVFAAIMTYVYIAFKKVYSQSILGSAGRMVAFLGGYAVAFFAVNLLYFMAVILLF